jgi:ArsR family transcriptional regulator
MNPDPKDVRRAADIFKALSHPSRLRIVCLLFDGLPKTQKELIQELGWPQSTVARHLAELRQAGLVTATRKGSEVLLEVGSPVAGQLMTAVCEWVHPETGERFTEKYDAILAEEKR